MGTPASKNDTVRGADRRAAARAAALPALAVLLLSLVLALPRPAAAAGGAAGGASAPAAGAAPAGPVVLMRIDGAIGPATADYLHRGLARAAFLRARLAVVQLDTPGGLDLAMRGIIRDILASPVPVAAYVAPDGARAASAGTYIVYASHVAAMAPASNLGAATPVAIGLPLPGGRPEGAPPAAPPRPASGASAPAEEAPHGDPMAAKRLSDAAAYIRSLAQLRGRNADWAERAVRESASLSSAEALADGVIDLVAADLPGLLRRVDGRRVAVPGGTVVLATRDAPVVAFEADWRNRALGAITDPGIALLLMMIGLGGLLAEFLSPGAVLPGVAGGICLLVAMFALQMLPVSYAGLGLVVLGAALLAAEAFVPSFGVLGLGGIAAFVLGALFLIDTDVPGFGVPLPLVAGVGVVFAGFVFLVAGMAAGARGRPLVGAAAGLVGETGEVSEFSAGAGWATVRGTPWRVLSADALAPGQRVRVTGVHGIHLRVEAEPLPPPAHPIGA